MRKKRILFAAVDIGFRIELYTKFVDSKLSDKLSAESFTKFKLAESHYKTSYTHMCEVGKHSTLYVYVYTFLFFIYSLFRYDIFHFLSGETILTRKLRPIEFYIYRLFGKRIVMHFVGSDIRNPGYLFWKDANLVPFLDGARSAPLTLPWQDKLIKDSLKYADSILVSTPDLLEIIPSARYYPVLIDLEKFYKEVGLLPDETPEKVHRDPYTVLHAPSNNKVKGTNCIHDALDKMLEKYGDGLNCITPGHNITRTGKLYSVSRYDLFGLLKESDVLIDQLVIGWYGLQSLEGLLCGNIVLCYIEENLVGHLASGCPVVNVNAKTLAITLDELIAGRRCYSNDEIRKNIEWVRKNHTIEENHSALLEAWGVSLN